MKIDYEMKVSEDQVFGRCIDADAPKDYVPSLVVLPKDMPSGRYRVRVERIRASLPPHHSWRDNTIVRSGHPSDGDCEFRVDAGRVYMWRGEAAYSIAFDPGVIDAFRAEGLLPPAEAQS